MLVNSCRARARARACAWVILAGDAHVIQTVVGTGVAGTPIDGTSPSSLLRCNFQLLYWHVLLLGYHCVVVSVEHCTSALNWRCCFSLGCCHRVFCRHCRRTEPTASPQRRRNRPKWHRTNCRHGKQRHSIHPVVPAPHRSHALRCVRDRCTTQPVLPVGTAPSVADKLLSSSLLLFH